MSDTGVPWASIPAAVAGPAWAGEISGDHEPTKAAVMELFDTAGCTTIDLGDLVTGDGMQQFGGPLAGHNLVQLPSGGP
jgi:predicted dinucleotide-binding enzyme